MALFVVAWLASRPIVQRLANLYRSAADVTGLNGPSPPLPDATAHQVIGWSPYRVPRAACLAALMLTAPSGESAPVIPEAETSQPAMARAWKPNTGVQAATVALYRNVSVNPASGPPPAIPELADTTSHQVVNWAPYRAPRAAIRAATTPPLPPDTPLAPITGTATITLGPLTCAATGQVAVTGTSAITLGALTLSAAGIAEQEPYPDSGAITVVAWRDPTLRHARVAQRLGANLALSPESGPPPSTPELGDATAHQVVGWAPYRAPRAAIATLRQGGWPVEVAAGPITGTASITLGPLTSTATGTVAITGNLAQTLGPLTLTASGVIGSVPITGDAAITLGPLTSVATGTVATTGTAGITLGPLVSTATGAVAISGSLSRTLGPLTLEATGAIGAVPITGSAAITLGPLTATSSGTVGVSGVLAKTLAPLTLAATGAVEIKGTTAQTLGALTLTAAGAITPGGATVLPDQRDGTVRQVSPVRTSRALRPDSTTTFLGPDRTTRNA